MIKDYPVKHVDLETGERIAYRQAGAEGPVVVLVHGNMSSSLHFATTMEKLEGKYRVYALDLPGFGDSTYNRELQSLHDFSRDVTAFLEKMDLQDVNLLGWSTGGGIVLETAADVPDRIRKLILLDSVGLQGYPMYRKGPDFQPILTERIYQREDIAVDPVQVLPILDAYASGNREFLKAVWNAAIYNLRQPEEADYEQYLDAIFQQRNLVDVDVALAQFNMTSESNGVVEGSGRMNRIKAPVVILHGEDDLVVPVAEAYKMKEWFGEQAELITFKGVGHSIVTDDLERFIEALEEALEKETLGKVTKQTEVQL